MDSGALTTSERRRGAALRHRADRDAYAAAHLLVRHCAAALTGRAAGTLEVMQQCAECGSPEHGKPSVAGLPDLHVSLAHTRGAVVAAADWHPVGVDVEDPRRGLASAVMTYALSAAETARVHSAPDPSTAFLRHWVRKECLVKMGVVTLDGLSRIELDPRTDRRLGGGLTVGRFGSLHIVDWFDGALDVMIAAAGSSPPVVRAFSIARRADAGGSAEPPSPS